MRTRPRATIEDLRVAVQCLPRTTRVAMLDGIRSNEIIVGAYSNNGGICPMLAAHRNGGRTSMISFAKAWDRFALGGARRMRPRRATERELRVLITQLEASLLDEALPETELAAAIESHRRLVARSHADGGVRRTKPAPRGTETPGDSDRSTELRPRPGWAWSRVVRSYNEYERALEWIERERAGFAEPWQGSLADREHQPA